MSPMNPLRSLSAALVSLSVFGISATAGATIVSTIAPYSATPAPGVWFESDTRAGGAVSVADLTDQGPQGYIDEVAIARCAVTGSRR